MTNHLIEPSPPQDSPKNAEYWNTIAAFYEGTLSESDRRRLFIQGAFFETAARERGTSYLPFPQQEEYSDVPVWDLPEELLVLIGLTVPAVAAIAQKYPPIDE